MKLQTNHEHVYHVVYDNPVTGEHWEDMFENLVTNVGLDLILSTFYGATAKTAAFYTGLITGPGAGNTYAPGDTMGLHAGWTEAVPYGDATRRTVSFDATSLGQSISNSGSPAIFNINADATIAGCFLVDVNTKSSGTGNLMGVGNFQGGDRSVSIFGVLTVIVTAVAA